MNDDKFSIEKPSLRRLLVPSLILASFAVAISGPMINVLSVDFAKTFQVPVGVAAQLNTVNNAAQVVLALAMGFLAIRFRHRLLLLAGILFVSIFAIGGFLASNLFSLQIFFAIEGAGDAMVAIMGATIIGDYLPLRKKAKAISYITSGTTLATFVGTPVIGLITNIGGWRPVFLVFALPVSVVGLLMAFFILPREPRGQQLAGKKPYLGSFRGVLSNRSAVAALVGAMIASAVPFVLFALSFYREQFSQPRDFIVGIFMAGQFLSIVGSLVAGRLTNRFGTKPLIVVGGLVTGILAVSFFSMTELWSAVTLNMLHAFLFGLGFTAARCLILDQVPSSRSTIMSLTAIVLGIGTAIGTAVGGALLVLFSYQIMGVEFGALTLGATCIIYFLTKDPYKNISR